MTQALPLNAIETMTMRSQLMRDLNRRDVAAIPRPYSKNDPSRATL